MSLVAPQAKLSGNTQGALWMLASGVGFTVMVVCIKLLAERGFAETQMVFVRCALGMVLLTPLILRARDNVWATPRPWVMARRCLATGIGLLASFYAFAHLPLATAQSLSFTRSLFVVVLAMLLLREQVGLLRQGAVAIGFIGVLVMVRPAELEVSWAVIAMLGSAALVAYSVVTIKDLTRDHSTLTLVAWLNATTALVGLPLALFAWRTLDLADAALFLVVGFAGVAAQSCFTRGIAAGEASMMALMDYLRLPMAALAGFIVFHEVLDAWTLAGAVIVIGSTVFITVREQMLEKKRAAPPPD